MLRELEIRSREDLILAREMVRELARLAGCDPVIETRLVAGLSDLAERFYHGTAGRLVLRHEGAILEAVLEHTCDSAQASPTKYPSEGGGAPAVSTAAPDAQSVLLAVGSVRFMWDEVDVYPAVTQGLKVVLRSWLR